MGNTVNLRGAVVPIPALGWLTALEAALLLVNELRSHDDIRVAHCGGAVVTQQLVSRYCTTMPIRSDRTIDGSSPERGAREK